MLKVPCKIFKFPAPRSKQTLHDAEATDEMQKFRADRQTDRLSILASWIEFAFQPVTIDLNSREDSWLQRLSVFLSAAHSFLSEWAKQC